MQHNSLENLIKENGKIFKENFFELSQFTSAAPGRINIIGEHTDYNLGLAMPAAINRWVLISFGRREDMVVHIKSMNYSSELRFSIGEIPVLTESWQKYVYGAFSLFSETNPATHGFNAVIFGNVPLGFGVSSSAAIEVAMVNGLKELYAVPMSDLQVVKLCQRVEHEFLHLQSGLLDQYASQFSQQGKLMILDFYSMDHSYIESHTEDFEWVLVNSGVTRELAHSGYSQRVKETQDALKYIRSMHPEVKNFRDLKESHLELLPDPLWKKRIRHYLSENERVLLAMENIRQKNFEALGKNLWDSHRSLRDDYESSCKELDYLAEEAFNSPYCLGSRIMGGGFGGCTLNLVYKEKRNDFTTYMEKKYSAEFNRTPMIDSYQLVNGAGIYPS